MRIAIPTDYCFTDLKLRRSSDRGAIAYDQRVIEAICKFNPPLAEVFEAHPEQVSAFIVLWYRQHLEAGGLADPLLQDLEDEIDLENRHGSGFSYAPGNA